MASIEPALLAGEIRVQKWMDGAGDTFVTFEADEGVSEFEVLGMLRVAAGAFEKYLTGLYEEEVGEPDD